MSYPVTKGAKPLTDMDITYIFIRYISVAIKRKSKMFYQRYNRTLYYENKELIEDVDMKNSEIGSNTLNIVSENIEEKITFRDQLFEGLNSLRFIEKQLIYEKFLNQRTDAEIGRDLSISGQMVSRKKRDILYKLRNFFI